MASAEQSIKAAKDRLRTSRFGLQDMISHPDRRLSGLMNAVVFGRMATFALQNMSSSVPTFDEWYERVRKEFQQDPLMRAFHQLRNQIEKQTEIALNHGLFVTSFSSADIPKPAPEFATSFVLGSAQHGNANGWILSYPDGTEGFYPVTLPPENVRNVISFRDFPSEYQYEEAETLIEMFLANLERVVERAEKQFMS